MKPSAEMTLSRWRHVCGERLDEEASDKLSIFVDDSSHRLTDIKICQDILTGIVPGASANSGGSSADVVRLEFKYDESSGVVDTDRFSEAFAITFQETLKEQRVSEFRAQLAEKNKRNSLRQRKGAKSEKKSAEVEGGDEADESWRKYLRSPVAETRPLVEDVQQCADGRLTCRVALPLEVAEELGRLAFPDSFRTETWSKIARPKKKEDNHILGWLFCVAAFMTLIALLWAILLIKALLKK